MLTQMQKMLRAKPTAIIVEVAIPDACGGNVEVLKAEKILSWIYLMGNCIWRGCHWQHEGIATGHLAVLSSVFFLLLYIFRIQVYCVKSSCRSQ